MSILLPAFIHLNDSNYTTWAGNMRGFLHSAGLWRIVSSDNKYSSPVSTPTDTQLAAVELWHKRSEKAASLIFQMVEDHQKSHFNGIDDDSIKMWNALETVHMQKKPGTRFNAYDNLFSFFFFFFFLNSQTPKGGLYLLSQRLFAVQLV
jgi:hypothetical protein